MIETNDVQRKLDDLEKEVKRAKKINDCEDDAEELSVALQGLIDEVEYFLKDAQNLIWEVEENQ